MKIGLIGINRYANFLNFACNLHVYAFQEYLTQRGHDVTIIDYRPNYAHNFNMRKPHLTYMERVARKKVNATGVKTPQQLKQLVSEYSEALELAQTALEYKRKEQERASRFDKFERFIDEHLNFTAEKYDSDLLEVIDPGFDVYMCVTDVIWSHHKNQGFDRGFLLGSKAMDGKQKIAYAASRGVSQDYEGEVENLFFDYVSDIDSVGLREPDFVDYVNRKTDRNAELVLDPVMLHGKDFWDRIATKPQEENYLLLYYVMGSAPHTVLKAIEYAKLHNLTIVEMSDRPAKSELIEGQGVKHIYRYDVGLEEWLGYIKHADTIFTNSFHGCCFSVVFEKEFFVGKRMGPKVPNFLNTFGLGSRQFSGETAVEEMKFGIDYTEVNRILAEKRIPSEEFIETALAKAKVAIDSGKAKSRERGERRRHSVTYRPRVVSGTMSRVKFASERKFKSYGDVKKTTLPTGELQFTHKGAPYTNDGSQIAPPVLFRAIGRRFLGWNIRLRIDNRWFWLLEDGSLKQGKNGTTSLDDAPANKATVGSGERIEHIQVGRIRELVFVARWKRLF